jgi:pimeloyl-ACP methyl ester carboxylesterase
MPADAAPPTKPETVLILRGLTHYDPYGWPMNDLKDALEARGYVVTIANHTIGDDLTELPDILIGHSMGANAALKAAARLGSGPRLVVTLDPGKWPLYYKCPGYVRCVNLYEPRLLFGGGTISGRGAENYRMRNTDHATFPLDPKIINVVTRIVEEGKWKR